ncbi:MAG: ATPase [Gammaproteobacteria bacterium]|nr:MAG: ATPase [Gammaproteobacteria bacterium]
MHSHTPLKTRIPAVIFFVVLWLPLATSNVTFANNDIVDPARTEKELKQVKKKIVSLQRILKKTQSRRSATEEALRKSELEINKTQNTLRKTNQSIKNSQAEINQLKKEQSHLQLAKRQQKMALLGDIQAAYQTGRQEYIKLLLNQQEPEKLARVLKYYDYFHRARLENIQAFNNTLTQLQTNQQQLDKKLDQLTDAKKRLEVEKSSLQKAQQNRKKIIARLNASIKDKDKQISNLAANEKELQNLLKAVQETLADLPANVGDTTPFIKRKGKLNWPTKGKIVRSFHSKRKGSHLRWNGVVIRTHGNAPVKNIHRGRVVFSDWMRGFGLLTIIDHGDSYYTLYGHNDSLLKEAGDWVEMGEVIAYSGTSGGHSKPGLYFEIRRASKPVNPKKWCRG